MRDIAAVILEVRELPPARRREILKPYADRKNIGSMFIMLRGRTDIRPVLRALCDLSALPEARDIIGHYMDLDPGLMGEIFASPDPKVRKLGYELTGRTRPNQYFSELVTALETDQTEFVRPSIILALGNAKRSPAREVLSGYVIPQGEHKHRAAAESALKKALDSLADKPVTAHISALPKGSRVVVSSPSGKVALTEFKSLGFEASLHPTLMDYVSLPHVKKFEELYSARSFFKGYVHFAQVSSEEAALNALSQQTFSTLMHALFIEPIRYRIEITLLRSDMKVDRSRLTGKIVQILDGKHGFINSPSSYTCTVALLFTPEGIHLMIEPSGLLDRRFNYRKKSISASIAPAAAAAAVYSVKDLLRPDADVLDCFCGSGTMLFERSRFPYGSLTGSDNSTQAIGAARSNERVLKTGAQFLLKNAVTPFKSRYDEVITNMPFGLRVSNHAKNLELYRAFVSNLADILKPRGVAFLFTQEKKLLADEIALGGKLTVEATHRFSTGGLYPNLFVVRGL